VLAVILLSQSGGYGRRTPCTVENEGSPGRPSTPEASSL
jgi:hypothetical protein